MFSALTTNNNLIDIEDAIKHPKDKYFCRFCNGELIVKNGSVRNAHFAHKNNCCCDDYDNDMSDWHRNWQKRFPIKNREVVLELDDKALGINACRLKRKRRRADVLCCGYAIEFQNSPISSEEFEDRNIFYSQIGKKVIWIFNMIDAVDNGNMDCYDEWHNGYADGGKWSWSWARKTFTRYKTTDKNIIVFFQTHEESNENLYYLERVTWAINSDVEYMKTDFKRFCTSYYPANFEELFDKIKKRQL